MMAAALGSGVKALYVSTNTPMLYTLPFRRDDDGLRRLLVISKVNVGLSITLDGEWCNNGGVATVLAAAVGSPEPGFDEPVNGTVVGAGGTIVLGPWALATVICH